MAIGASSGRTLTFYEGGLEPTATGPGSRSSSTARTSPRSTSTPGSGTASRARSGSTNVALEEMSLVNVLRRDGCPLTVTSADGKIVYVEGRDFEPVATRSSAWSPYEGEYEFNHPGAPASAGDRLADQGRGPAPGELVSPGPGARLVNAACCLSEPKVYDLLRDQARRVNDLYHPKTFFMQHDELAGRQLVPRLPSPVSSRRANCSRTTPGSASRSSRRSALRPGWSSGRTCSTRTTTP